MSYSRPSIKILTNVQEQYGNKKPFKWSDSSQLLRIYFCHSSSLLQEGGKKGGKIYQNSCSNYRQYLKYFSELTELGRQLDSCHTAHHSQAATAAWEPGGPGSAESTSLSWGRERAALPDRNLQGGESSVVGAILGSREALPGISEHCFPKESLGAPRWSQ